METIAWADFERVEIRAGTILEASELPGARKPAYRLRIDFGEAGIRPSSAQITVRYTPEELVGRQVIAVLNFPPKRIAGFISECLTLGLADESGAVVLVSPTAPIPNGSRLF